MNVTGIQCVYFDDLVNAAETEELMGGFNNFSYGDAEYTLISPEILTSEIEDFLQDIDNSDDREKLIGTLNNLKEVPPNVLVAIVG